MENSKNCSIKLGIVEDEKLIRQLLAQSFKGLDRYRVILEAQDGRELQNRLQENYLPDVLLMDIAMPHLNGYETTCWLTKNHPSVKVLAVSKHDRESTINYIIGCGAKGFMSKYDGIDELIRAIENVYKNKFYLSSSKQTASLLHSLPGSKYAREKLTAREREFMRLLCTEKTYQEIANEMSINLGTAYSYRNSLFHKFQVNSREQVLFCCLNEGLVFL